MAPLHLGDAVEILEPAALRETYREMIEAALRAVAPPHHAARVQPARARRAQDRA